MQTKQWQKSDSVGVGQKGGITKGHKKMVGDDG